MMKVVSRPVNMICHFDEKGIHPLKFKYQEGDEYIIIKVDKVVSNSKEKLCGNIALIFDCQSAVNGVEKLYQLKYFPLEMTWILWKI